jgi:predicted GNAT family acetyltransferase
VTVQIVHDPNAREFFADIEGARPVLQYRYANGLMTIFHTGVPAPVANRGIAGELARTALEFARAQGWKVEPACSYIRAFMQKHVEYADLMLSGTTTAPPPGSTEAGEREREHTDALLDEALDESFPASDVPAIGGER